MTATLARVQPAAALTPASTQVLRRKCACEGSGHDCDECQKRNGLRRKAAGRSGPELAPPIVQQVLRSPGEPLDVLTRAFMEARFGHDFSRVRVHADPLAAESARSVNARAYTVGRDVVFAEGQYGPRTLDERRLLAHELTHVVQQGATNAGSTSALAVGRPEDAAEGEADAVAERAAADESALPASPLPAGGLVLRRQVRNSVITNFQKGARACVVHVHGEERTALAVGKEIRSRRCINLMHLDTTKRRIDFEFNESGVDFTADADPNRIFTPAGRRNEVAAMGLPKPKPGQDEAAKKVDSTKRRAKAEQVLQEFADQQFIPKLDECRKDDKNPDASLPVMALHNNEGLTPDKAVASQSRSPNPAKGDPASPSDFLLVTQASDFDALKRSHNVILQENPVQAANDDGSLSVLLADSRYVNVEKEGREHDKPVGKVKDLKTQDEIYIKNYAMATTVLSQLGVSTSPCPSSPEHERRTRSLFNRRLGQSGRQTTMLPTDQPMLEREELPDPAPKGCLLFKDQPALDRRADEWRERLEGIPLLNLIHWVLGGGEFTPPAALDEFKRQQKCMIGAMRASLKRQGFNLHKGDIKHSGQRTFADQKGIWSQKFAFTFPRKFDQITDFARTKCAPTLGTDVRWDPKSTVHQACWKQLSDDEKQKEILMASSAPGVSRHHTGVDFDIGQSGADLDPKEWTDTGRFADAYRWLARNGSAFGFIQPFDTKGGYGEGYMSERWHWSYYPVAQAALEFIMDHDDQVEAALRQLWSDGKGGIKPEFSFIAKDWRKYLFNVEQLGVF